MAAITFRTRAGVISSISGNRAARMNPAFASGTGHMGGGGGGGHHPFGTEDVTSLGVTLTELTWDAETEVLAPVSLAQREDTDVSLKSATLPNADRPAITPTTSEQAKPKVNARKSCFMDPVIISIIESVKEFFKKFFAA
jgi:hypothetical protein